MNSPPDPNLSSDPVLKRWGDFLRRNRVILVSMLGYAAVPPIVEFIFGIGPPWPHREGVIGLSSVVGYVAAIITYVNYAHGAATSAKMRVLRRAVIRLSIMTAAVLLVYLCLRAFFLYDAGGPRNQVAGGFLLRPEVAELLRTRPDLTFQLLLDSHQWVPEGIWIPWTVGVVNLAFLLGWLGLFGGLGALVSSFVAYLEVQFRVDNKL